MNGVVPQKDAAAAAAPPARIFYRIGRKHHDQTLPYSSSSSHSSSLLLPSAETEAAAVAAASLRIERNGSETLLLMPVLRFHSDDEKVRKKEKKGGPEDDDDHDMPAAAATGGSNFYSTGGSNGSSNAVVKPDQSAHFAVQYDPHPCADAFDAGADDDSTASVTMFERIGKSMVHSLINFEESATCLCHGPTSSGRRFTLFDEQYGLAPRIVDELLAHAIPQRLSRVDAAYIGTNGASISSSSCADGPGTTFALHATMVAHATDGTALDLLTDFERESDDDDADHVDSTRAAKKNAQFYSSRQKDCFNSLHASGLRVHENNSTVAGSCLLSPCDATRIHVLTPDHFRRLLAHANIRERSATYDLLCHGNRSTLIAASKSIVLYLDVIKFEPTATVCGGRSSESRVTQTRLTIAKLPATDFGRFFPRPCRSSNAEGTCSNISSNSSNRVSETKTHSDRWRSGHTALGNCLYAAGDAKTRHIPVRDSGLTHALRHVFENPPGMNNNSNNLYMIMALARRAANCGNESASSSSSFSISSIAQTTIDENRNVGRLAKRWRVVLQRSAPSASSSAASLPRYVCSMQKMIAVMQRTADDRKARGEKERAAAAAAGGEVNGFRMPRADVSFDMRDDLLTTVLGFKYTCCLARDINAASK